VGEKDASVRRKRRTKIERRVRGDGKQGAMSDRAGRRKVFFREQKTAKRFERGGERYGPR